MATVIIRADPHVTNNHQTEPTLPRRPARGAVGSEERPRDLHGGGCRGHRHVCDGRTKHASQWERGRASSGHGWSASSARRRSPAKRLVLELKEHRSPDREELLTCRFHGTTALTRVCGTGQLRSSGDGRPTRSMFLQCFRSQLANLDHPLYVG